MTPTPKNVEERLYRRTPPSNLHRRIKGLYYTKLKRIETGLRRARADIREAKFLNQTQNPDFVPSSPIYWNSKAFHRMTSVKG
uniref:Uncharacterized protein n=1 Tax=Cucumis melo TaxID=3656 RepID=A0A9I9DP76_CUCME